MVRDSLAKALYCRTVATIVRRANSLKRLGSTLGTLSSDSNESVHNQADVSNIPPPHLIFYFRSALQKEEKTKV